jgi:hypothetical protein
MVMSMELDAVVCTAMMKEYEHSRQQSGTMLALTLSIIAAIDAIV